MKRLRPTLEENRLLRALLRESLKVIHDVQTKTDIYLGYHDAAKRADQFDRAARIALKRR